MSSPEGLWVHGWGSHFFPFLTPNGTQHLTLVELTHSRPQKKSKAMFANCPFIRQGLLNAKMEAGNLRTKGHLQIELGSCRGGQQLQMVGRGRAGALLDLLTWGPWGTLGVRCDGAHWPPHCWFLSCDTAQTPQATAPAHPAGATKPWLLYLRSGPATLPLGPPNGDIWGN